MLSEPPSPLPEKVDLLVIGATTVDRFEPAPDQPGGTPLHVARALAPRGVSLGVMTAAGPEPVAQRGIEELGALAADLHVTRGARTSTFRHREAAGRARRLWLEETGPRLALPDPSEWPPSRAILFAPIAGELPAAALAQRDAGMPRGVILQGWLRATNAEGEVTALALDRLDAAARDALARIDLIVASREDLVAEAAGAREQVRALRDSVGPRPALAVTDGVDGIWISARGDSTPERVEVATVIAGVPTVGAGDIFAAWLLLGDWPALPDQEFLARRTRLAAEIVAEVLASRASR